MKKQLSRQLFNRYKTYSRTLPEYNSAATARWICNESKLPWLKLDINIPHQTILEEINNIKHLLSEHRDDYSEHAGWSSFCIHGKAYDATREDDYYNDSRAYVWTPEAVEGMPKTVEFFKTWPALDYRRLRIMRLAPGGYISLHSDTNESRLWPINIAITQPNECAFVMANFGEVPFSQGDALLLDISNYHTVFNDSDQDRWHLIIHQHSAPAFEDLVVKSYKKLYNKL